VRPPAADEHGVATNTQIGTPLGTRAVLRSIDAGSSAACASCGEQVKFSAKTKRQQVICNVYVHGRWDRVEHFHADCYHDAGDPHGQVA
jgi:hypothetical protein